MTDDELYESICTLGEKDLASDEHFARHDLKLDSCRIIFIFAY